MLWSLAVLALLSSAQGRAVNISNTWVLPEEGFPVFYRYFRDRISWYEADAVCQFHHANLVTVDTTAQYDAVRAYLKELDISSAVWVGLIRSNPDGDFTWTDYRGMSGDGYWSAAPDSRSAPLCAAADPAADYRWEARACGGPMVASFICELPVPQWALGSEGCMIRALPALTVLYLPESASVQLTTDCGLAGVKRVQCTGNMKRDKLLGDLSCPYEPEESTTQISSEMTTGTTDVITEQDNAQELTTEDKITAVHLDDVDQSMVTTARPVILNKEEKSNRVPLTKDLEFKNLLIHDNNLESNDIPKISDNGNTFLNEEESEKLEDENNKQHKMLHNELARQGNLGYFETIFSQPADHFVPPLVMAKAKMSDDMTVLSLEEKHAQQLAEHRFLKYKNTQEVKHKADPHTEEMVITDKVSITESPIFSKQAAKSKDFKDKNYKYGTSKKYNEKYGEAKGKNMKIPGKPVKYADKVQMEKQTEFTLKHIKSTFTMALETTTSKNIMDDDSAIIDLSVIIREPEVDESSTVNPISSTKFERTSIGKEKNEPELSTRSSEKTSNQNFNQSVQEMTHEVIKITILNEEHPSAIPTVFEFTTRLPVSESSSLVKQNSTAAISIENITETLPVSQEPTITTDASESISSESNSKLTSKLPVLVADAIAPTVTENNQDILSTEHNKDSLTTNKLATTTFTPITDATSVSIKLGTSISKEESPIKTDAPSSTTEINFMNDTELLNSTEFHEEEFEILHDNDEEGLPPVSDDFQSPLLSAASEPLHRPARSRRPPPNQHKLKFNPFRILG